jgi:hypothetical protein
MPKSQATATTDHQEIRRWAEQRGANPACVRGTGDDADIGILRLDFPGYSGQDSLQHITWDEWFRKFDERGLALLHQDSTARGQKSNFNKLISRDTARAKTEPSGKSSGRAERGRSTTRRSSSAGRRAASTTSKKRSAATSGRSRSSRTSSTRTGRSTGTRQRVTAAATRRAGRSSGGRSGGARPLTDHEEIRRWAEDRRAAPACVRGTGGKRGDVGMIRLDFPGFSGQRLEHIDWDDWFKAFDDSKLALLVQDTTARGQTSNFNKLVGRETAEKRQRGISGASRRHPERASSASGSKTRGRESNKSTAKSTRGSTRAKRTESVRGRTTSRRKAA